MPPRSLVSSRIPSVGRARRRIDNARTKATITAMKLGRPVGTRARFMPRLGLGPGGGGFTGGGPFGPPGIGGPFGPGGISAPFGPGFPPPSFPGGGGGGIGRLCGLLPPGLPRDLCRAGTDVFGGGGNGGGGGGGGRSLGTPSCEEGTIRIGDTCVALGDAFPGGDPLFTAAGGTPTLGRYGVAMTPTMEQRPYRRCPDGMRLGDDDLCYDRAVMGRRSNKRKWKAPKRPPISVRQMNALKALESARSAVRDLAGSADLKVQSKSAAARKAGFLKGRGVKTS